MASSSHGMNIHKAPALARNGNGVPRLLSRQDERTGVERQTAAAQTRFEDLLHLLGSSDPRIDCVQLAASQRLPPLRIHSCLVEAFDEGPHLSHGEADGLS